MTGDSHFAWPDDEGLLASLEADRPPLICPDCGSRHFDRTHGCPYCRIAALEADLFAARADSVGPLHLVARIREAAGDPHGKLMQDELVGFVGALAQGIRPQDHDWLMRHTRLVDDPTNPGCRIVYYASDKAQAALDALRK